MGIKGTLWLGLLGYLFFLAASFPASLAWSWLRVDPGVLTLEEISGTPWSGGAARIIAAHFEMGPLQWKIPIDSLLKLTPRITLDLKGKDAFHLQGSVMVDKALTVYVQEIVFSSPLSSMSPLLVRIPVDLVGQLEVYVDHLAVDDGKVVAIRARGQLMNFAVGIPWDKALGGYTLEAKLGVDGEVLLHIRDVDGVVQTALVMKLYADGRYVLRGSVRAGKGMDDQMANLLKQWIGLERGKVLAVRVEGNLGSFL